MNVSQGPVYIPRRRKPTLLKSPAAREKLSTADPRWGRVVLNRSMTENGGTLFTLGTKSRDTLTQDAEDVPFAQILCYVTPSELARFENADYEAEDEAERIHLENMRPRGRPRKDGTATGNGLKVPKTPKPAPSSGLASGGYSAFRGEGQPKKRGRPVGWRKNGVPATPGGPVPSFNGPQPTGEVDTEPEMTTREQTEDLAEKRLDIQAKTGVYSMVSASGLGPQVPDSETEMETREPTPSLNHETPDEPTPKRRRVEVDASSPSTPFETAPPSPVLQGQSGSEEDERLNLLDQFTSSSQQQTTPHRPKDKHPKRQDQSTIKAQPNRPSSSSSDEDERLNLLDQFTSNSLQRNISHRPKINPPKPDDQPTLKAQPNRPSRSTSDEDERLNLLDQFTAKPHHQPPRSSTTSTQDSMLSSMRYTSPTKPPAVPLPKIPPSLPVLHSKPKPTLTPQRPPKRTSMTPHYPSSAGGVIPIPVPTTNDEPRRRRSSLLATPPSKTRTDKKSRHQSRAVPTIPLSPSKPATLTPAPPYRRAISSKPRQPQQQQRPSTRSSSSLNTYQADTVRAMDSYFSPRKHTQTGNKDRNNIIDPRLRSSRTASSNPSNSSDEGNSGESFMGVAEPPRPQPKPAPAKPVEGQVGRRATAVKVVVVSPGHGKGNPGAGAGVARRGAREVDDGEARDREPRISGKDTSHLKGHGVGAEPRNGLNSHPDARTEESEDEEVEDSDDDDDDDDAGSIEL